MATELIQPVLNLTAPLTNVLVALPIAMLMPRMLRRGGPLSRLGAVALSAGLFAGYHLACLNRGLADWLSPLNSPLLAVLVLIVLPAMYLPRGRAYRFFLILPAAALALAVLAVRDAYSAIPKGQGGFYWLLIRPAYLIGGLVSLLVLLQPLLRLCTFRRLVRATCLAVLVYGGFAFRADYADYQAMLARRRTQQPGIMNLSETSPVLQDPRRMLHLPAAPCRFTADGGYVQGCVMEQLQRVMQVDLAAVGRLDPATVQDLAVLLGAVVMLAALLLLAGRAFCGWVCPLSALGDVLDWTRRKLGLGHFKPPASVKAAFLATGAGVGGLTLAMANAFPRLNQDGRFLGCKLPIYPFCKICPSQQICPVAAGGLGSYPGLPTWEWCYGFFTAACVGLLGVFLLGFMTSRRLWCRLCPMGLLEGLFNRGSLLRLVKDAGKCNRCGICTDVCPMDIDRVRAEVSAADVTDTQCVLCLKCLEKCPRDGCLSLEHGGLTVTSSAFARQAPRGEARW